MVACMQNRSGFQIKILESPIYQPSQFRPPICLIIVFLDLSAPITSFSTDIWPPRALVWHPLSISLPPSVDVVVFECVVVTFMYFVVFLLFFLLVVGWSCCGHHCYHRSVHFFNRFFRKPSVLILHRHPIGCCFSCLLVGVLEGFGDFLKFVPRPLALLYLSPFVVFQRGPSHFWTIFFYLVVFLALYFLFWGLLVKSRPIFQYFNPCKPFPICLKNNNNNNI